MAVLCCPAERGTIQIALRKHIRPSLKQFTHYFNLTFRRRPHQDGFSVVVLRGGVSAGLDQYSQNRQVSLNSSVK